jgi:WD40 repeat protein
VADQKQIQTLAAQPNANIMATGISPDGNFAAGAVFDTGLFTAGGSICVWDVATGEMVKTIRSATGSGEYFFSRDGKHVFTTSGYEPDGRVLMADVASGERLATFLGVPGSIEIVSEIGIHKLVAAGSQGRTLVWDPETGEEICRFIHVGISHEWICITPRGYFECSDSGREFVQFRIPDTLDFVNDAETFNQFHRPNLFARILAGERDVDLARQ